jgi:rhodanese-related sulfurtransferase
MKKPLALLAALFPAAAAASPTPPSRGDAALDVPPGIVDADTARRLVAAGVTVVDVRTKAEFDAGHVPGALNVPFDEISARAAELGPPSAPVLLYCRTGRRTAIATQALRAKGFTRIYDLQAYDRWRASEPPPAR